jgi:hypothetical protein
MFSTKSMQKPPFFDKEKRRDGDEKKRYAKDLLSLSLYLESKKEIQESEEERSG